MSALRRLRPVHQVSRRPSERDLPALTFPDGAECFVCGAPLVPGSRVLMRAFDVRVSCATCPWPASAIAEPTK